jgi:hypothetical protein
VTDQAGLDAMIEAGRIQNEALHAATRTARPSPNGNSVTRPRWMLHAESDDSKPAMTCGTPVAGSSWLPRMRAVNSDPMSEALAGAPTSSVAAKRAKQVRRDFLSAARANRGSLGHRAGRARFHLADSIHGRRSTRRFPGRQRGAGRGTGWNPRAMGPLTWSNRRGGTPSEATDRRNG